MSGQKRGPDAAIPIYKGGFLDLMRSRRSCKRYDTARPLSEGDMAFILECARLSPSSFGIEHWQIYALTDSGTASAAASVPLAKAATADRRRALFEACFSQESVATAPLAVVLAARRGAAYDPDGDLIRERGSRFPGGYPVFRADYEGYYRYLAETGRLDGWARAQCYIPCANMMTGAQERGISSCAIEGFDDADVLSVLGLDAALWQTGIVTVFGYCAETEAREQIRMPAADIVTRL